MHVDYQPINKSIESNLNQYDQGLHNQHQNLNQKHLLSHEQHQQQITIIQQQSSNPFNNMPMPIKQIMDEQDKQSAELQNSNTSYNIVAPSNQFGSGASQNAVTNMHFQNSEKVQEDETMDQKTAPNVGSISQDSVLAINQINLHN